MTITAGPGHTCAVLADGTARCWGKNWNGQLGNGTSTDSITPVVSSISNAAAISAGSYHSCAVLTDGIVQCWGDNGFGQLGDGTSTGSTTPVVVSGINNAVAITASYSHTCAALAGGTARCWGNGYYGQLGDGSKGYFEIPVGVLNISNTAIPVQWNSSNNSVASIDRKGIAKGITPGTTTITVSVAGITGTATLTVSLADTTPPTGSLLINNYNAPQNLDRVLRCMLTCHNLKGGMARWERLERIMTQLSRLWWPLKQ